jgi:hypothetical protein
MTNRIFAISMATPATPTKPKNPAIRANTKNKKAQYNMARSPFAIRSGSRSEILIQQVNSASAEVKASRVQLVDLGEDNGICQAHYMAARKLRSHQNEQQAGFSSSCETNLSTASG